MHLATPVLRVRRVALAYAPVIVPLARLWYTGDARATVPHPIVYAFGLAPFGLKLTGEIGKHRIYYSSAVGGIWSNHDVPVPRSSAFNVTMEFGGGVEIHTWADHALQMGFKFHHLSNVYQAPENPGLDANMVYVGWRSVTRLGW